MPIGASQTNSTSSSSKAYSRWAVLALLLGAGMLAGYLHQTLRMPLKLPGRHGLEFMAIMIFARCAARNTRLAGMTVGVGSAAMTALLSHGFTLELSIFVLQGLALDFIFPKARAATSWVLALTIAAGVVHALKPLLQWTMSVLTPWSTNALSSGLGYPLLTHLIFGSIGGLCGALAWKATQKKLNPQV